MPASLGVQGPGETIKCEGARRDLVERDLVVAADLDRERRVDFPQPLHEVVGERIVVIDQQDHVFIGGGWRETPAIAFASTSRANSP